MSHSRSLTLQLSPSMTHRTKSFFSIPNPPSTYQCTPEDFQLQLKKKMRCQNLPPKTSPIPMHHCGPAIRRQSTQYHRVNAIRHTNNKCRTPLCPLGRRVAAACDPSGWQPSVRVTVSVYFVPKNRIAGYCPHIDCRDRRRYQNPSWIFTCTGGGRWRGGATISKHNQGENNGGAIAEVGEGPRQEVLGKERIIPSYSTMPEVYCEREKISCLRYPLPGLTAFPLCHPPPLVRHDT
jgi:hypothetical protein